METVGSHQIELRWTGRLTEKAEGIQHKHQAIKRQAARSKRSLQHTTLPWQFTIFAREWFYEVVLRCVCLMPEVGRKRRACADPYRARQISIAAVVM